MKKDNDRRELAEMYRLSSLGLTLVIASAIGLGTGVFLDRVFHTTPYCTVVFFIFGIMSGFWQFIKEIQKVSREK